MATKRMFSNRVIDTAAFLRMSPTARLLYFDMGMKADDDGFVEAFTVMRTTGTTGDDDLHVLSEKGFVKILNDDLLCWIVHWRENNIIRNDRYRPSLYHDLLVQLEGDNQTTTACQPSDNQTTPTQQPNDTQTGVQRLTQDSIGKVSQGEVSQVQSITGDDDLQTYLEGIEFLHGLSAQVLAYRDRLPDDVIRFGAESALECGGRSLNYVKTVLNNYIKQGLTSVEAVQQHEVERKGGNTTSEKKPLNTLRDYRNGMGYDDWMAWIQAHSREFDHGDYPGDFETALRASLTPEECERREQELYQWELQHSQW